MRRVVFPALLAIFCVLPAGAGEKASYIDRHKVGEWAVYRVMGMDEFRQRHSIKAIDGDGDDRVFIYEVVTLVKGKEVDRAEFKRTAAELRADDEQTMKKVSRQETVVINGKEVVADVIEEEKDGKRTTIWGSDDLPVNGVIKVVQEGQPPMSELLDFGYAE